MLESKKYMQLKSPLLDESNGENRASISLKHQVYASNSPKIMLEQITKRTTTIILLLTYVVFIVCFILDVLGTVESFRSGDRYLKAGNCSVSDSMTYLDWGCASNSTWYGYVGDFENIISVALQVSHQNSVNSCNLTYTIEYSVSLYACDKDKCSFSNYDSSLQDSWDLVLRMNHEQITDIQSILIDDSNENTCSVDMEIFGNTFQNQEGKFEFLKFLQKNSKKKILLYLQLYPFED